MPLTPEEFSEVPAYIGHAVWQIQVLEETVALHLVLVHKVDAKTARRDVATMFARASKQTLGQLLRGIRDTKKTPSDLLARLETFVDERNWLVHHSRESRNRFQVVTRTLAGSGDSPSAKATTKDASRANKARFVNVDRLICARSYHFVVALGRAKEAQSVA
jgi:hypothetical protein